jgi:hypothetical protein
LQSAVELARVEEKTALLTFLPLNNDSFAANHDVAARGRDTARGARSDS